MGNLRGSPAKLENDDEGCIIEQGSPLGGGLPAAEARAEDEREGQQDADGACGRGATWGGEGRLQSGQTWQARSLLEWPVTKDGEKGQEWGHSPAELSVTPHIYNLPYVLPPGPGAGRSPEAAPGYRAQPAPVQDMLGVPPCSIHSERYQ